MFAVAFGLAATLSSGAAAQVLSIGEDGGVTTYSGPAVYTDAEVTTIAPPEAARMVRAAPEEVVQLIRESSARHAVPAQIVPLASVDSARYEMANHGMPPGTPPSDSGKILSAGFVLRSGLISVQ